MKRNFMKKAVAVSLSAAMALSLSSATALTASAATSTVAMAKTASVKVGKSKTLKLTKNTKKWTVKAVSSRNKKYCTVKKTGSTKVQITGKKATAKSQTVVIRVRVKSSVKKVEKVLKCKVTVKGTTSTDPTTPDNPDPGTPDNPDPVVETKKTVANQAELDAALADSNIKEITIQTADKVDLTIPEGTHSDVDLIVDAALASITNSATFKSVTINNLSPDTWREKGKGNKFTFKAPNVHFVAEETAEVANIVVAAKGTINITGKAAKAIPVTVEAAAADSVITSETTVTLIAAAQITLTLEKDAKGSTVTLQRGAVKFSITLTNKTDDDIAVKTDDGKTVVTAPKNSTAPTTAEAPVTDTTTPVDPSNPGTTTPVRSELPGNAVLGVADVKFSAGSNSITPKKAETVTGDAVNTTSPSAFESYSIGTEIRAEGVKALLEEKAANNTDKIYKDLGTGVEYYVEVFEGNKLIDATTFDSTKTLYFTKEGTYKLVLHARTKQNDTYYRGGNAKLGSLTVIVTEEEDKVTIKEKDTFEKDDSWKAGNATKYANAKNGNVITENLTR